MPESNARFGLRCTAHSPPKPTLIDDSSLAVMKPGVVIVNASRGALVDARALIAGLKWGKIGHFALDVYEEEADLFFEDLSDRVIQDDVFSRLLTFPNVLITGHKGFFTNEALSDIARTTLANISAFESGRGQLNRVTATTPGGWRRASGTGHTRSGASHVQPLPQLVKT